MNIPNWIDQDISPCDIARIVQGGCASGAYKPAFVNHIANEVMSKHGDEVLNYIVEMYGSLPKPEDTESWSGMACFYLSFAVDLWALLHEKLADWEDDEPLTA